jgi:hypothetical protein
MPSLSLMALQPVKKNQKEEPRKNEEEEEISTGQ